jgi:two-component system, response regulator
MMHTEFEILLVEDTRSDAEMIIRAIRKGKITNSILRLQDGKEALDFIFGTGEYTGRDIQQKPKVILLDLKMPRVSGIQVLQQLKANDLTKQIPIVVLTSSKENPDVEQCYALGVNSFIVKPVEIEDFMNVVSSLGVYWLNHNQAPA